MAAEKRMVERLKRVANVRFNAAMDRSETGQQAAYWRHQPRGRADKQFS